ncbi:MAG TPA: WbqC family protein [Acidimicrobiales bacterium]|nr:WbqC family protein [Acidimicrobiales bacterium]
MRVGIMQPYFFPYLGYFSLIERVDSWVVFDITQYTPKTWMNRNRVLHPSGGWNWITVPLTNSSRSIVIHEAVVADAAATQRSTLGKLSHYRNRAPYWREVEQIVRAAFAAEDGHSLVDLNVRGLGAVCSYLGIRFEPLVCSTLGLDLAPPAHPGGWAPAIARALGADEYINPIGGLSLFDPAEFTGAGIALGFLDQPPFTYDTGPYGFESSLSILDVLMWNSPSAVRAAMAAAAVIPAAETVAA